MFRKCSNRKQSKMKRNNYMSSACQIQFPRKLQFCVVCLTCSSAFVFLIQHGLCSVHD